MKKIFTEEKMVEAFKRFHSAHGRYPAQADLLHSDYLPTYPTIYRMFGSLPKFREKHGMGGDMRSETARLMNTRMNKWSEALFDLQRMLVDKFGKSSVVVTTRGATFTKEDGSKISFVGFYPEGANGTKNVHKRITTDADWIVCLNPDIPQEDIHTPDKRVIALDSFKVML